MLKKIENLPANIIGVQAYGIVSEKDYEDIIGPLFKYEHGQGKPIRFLYQFTPEFEKFTPGAAWDDFQIGLKYLNSIEKCAIVSDDNFISSVSKMFIPFIPYPCRVYSNSEWQKAVDWLSTNIHESSLKYNLNEKKVLVVEPDGPLCKEDFEKMAEVVDPIIEKQGKLNGLVICVKKFPGWENFGSFIHHIQFVKDHHKKISKIALCSEGILPELAAHLAKHFIQAEIRDFDYKELNQAIHWASLK